MTLDQLQEQRCDLGGRDDLTTDPILGWGYTEAQAFPLVTVPPSLCSLYPSRVP